MAEKAAYPEFRDLLRKACVGRTKKEFAEAIGITPEHLSRLLNAEEINRPSKHTLESILKVVPDLNAVQLFTSCGYDRKDCVVSHMIQQHDMTPAQRMSVMVDELTKGFGQFADVRDTYKYFNTLFATYLTKYVVGVRNIHYHENKIAANSMQPEKKGEWVIPCEACWDIRRDFRSFMYVTTYFLLFFSRTESGMLIPMDIAFDAVTLNVFGCVPQAYLDSLYEDGEALGNVKHVSVSRLMEKQGSTKEERLLRAIFGDDGAPKYSFLTTNWGRGSVWEEHPEHFGEYVAANGEYFDKSEEELELLEDFKVYPQTYHMSRTLMDRINAYHFGAVSGEMAIAYAIMTRKFAALGYDFDIRCEETTEDAAYPLKPVIYVDEDYMLSDGKWVMERRDKLDSILKPEFRAIGLKTYGTTLSQIYLDVPEKDLKEMQEPLEAE